MNLIEYLIELVIALLGLIVYLIISIFLYAANWIVENKAKWLSFFFLLFTVLKYIDNNIERQKIGYHRDKTHETLTECINMHNSLAEMISKMRSDMHEVTYKVGKLADLDPMISDFERFKNATLPYLADMQYYSEFNHNNGGVLKSVADKFRYMAIYGEELLDYDDWLTHISERNVKLNTILKGMNHTEAYEEFQATRDDTNDIIRQLWRRGIRLSFLQGTPTSDMNPLDFNVTALAEIRDLYEEKYFLEKGNMEVEDHWLYNYFPQTELFFNPGLRALEQDEYFKELKYKRIPEALARHENTTRNFVPWLNDAVEEAAFYYTRLHHRTMKAYTKTLEISYFMCGTVAKIKSKVCEIASYRVLGQCYQLNQRTTMVFKRCKNRFALSANYAKSIEMESLMHQSYYYMA